MDTASFLVVEDEELGRRTIAQFVARRGLNIALVMAETARQAEARLAECERFAGILVDQFLPDGQGLTVLRHARARATHASTPMLVMTGAPDVHMINRVYDLRAEMITKPLKWDRLEVFFRESLARLDGTRKAPTASPTDDEREQIPETLDACIARLRELGGRFPCVKTRYRMGAVLAALKAQSHRYGPSAISVVAKALEEDAPSLYRHAAVAERWTLQALETLLARRGPDGRALTWSHLVILGSVESPSLRGSLADRAISEGLPVRALAALVADNQRN